MVKNFAHRGFSGKYPENTMLAFEKAIEAGADGIELDVQLTKDGVPVILHDETLRRTVGIPGYLRDFTLEEVKQMDASMDLTHNSKGEPLRCGIPTLREYFALAVRYPIITNVELKTSVVEYPGIEEKVLAVIDEFELRSRVIISSFNHYSVLRFKKLAPEVPCGLLEESRIVGMAEYAKRLGVEYLHPVKFAVTESYVREAREYGLGINVWTVNTEAELRRLAELGVQGIIGNYPDLARGILQNRTFSADIN